MKTFLFLALPAIMLLSACQPSPKAIDYGSDMCDFCKMTIVEAQYGAEAVTSKGKVYKFDAIECLANFVEQEQDKSFSHLLVNVYHAPKELVDVEDCQYLICKNLPSPMGAYLTAFSSKSVAMEMQKSKGGQVFDWPGVREYLIENGIVRVADVH